MQKLQKQLKIKIKILTSKFLKLSSKFGIRGVKKMIIKGTMREILNILGSMTEEEFRKKLGTKEVKK